MIMIQPESSWNLPPTSNQTRCIARLCLALGIRQPLEETVSTRNEARQVIHNLMSQLTARNNKKKGLLPHAHSSSTTRS